MPSAELRTPPPVDPQGQVVRPPPEKSFLQKYWMYFALLFLVICKPDRKCNAVQLLNTKIAFAGGGDERARQ